MDFLNKYYSKFFVTCLSIFFSTSLIFSSHVLAASGINETLAFQAKVVNTDGTNSTATCGTSCNFRFRIFTSASGGSYVWQETQSGLSVNDGVVSVNLGSSTPFGTSVDWNNDSLYLEVAMNANGVNGDGPNADGYEEVFDNPRIRLTAVPYAFNSLKLGGKSANEFAQIGGNTSGSSISIGTKDGYSLDFKTNNSVVGTFLSNGNFGVGTSNPGQKLTVDGTFGILEGGASPSYHTIFIGGDQSGDITYTLPVSSSNGVLRNTGGVLSWDTSSVSESDTLATVTGRGATTTAGITLNTNGLILSSVGTDITTGTNEDLTLLANGSGNIVVGSGDSLGNGTWNLASSGVFTGLTGLSSSGSITFTGLSAGASETSAIFLNGSNQLVTRILGSNAFNSTAFLTSESDSLSSVTGRGNTTSTALSLTGGASIRGITVDTATATDDRILTVVTSTGATRFDGTITNADLTASRTWTLPDINGTILTSGNGFAQNGNTFGTGAVLGTSDNNSLSFITNGSTRGTFDTSGNFELTSGTLTTASTTANIFNSAVTTLNIGGATTTLNLGSASGLAMISGGSLSISSANGTTLSIDSGTTGSLNIGTGANAKTITVGNSTGATSVNINSGTGNINLQVAGTATTGKVQIGAGGTGSGTPDLFVVDSKNTAGDPTGANGAIYYNTITSRFRCYENNVWVNCIGGASGSGSDLQQSNTQLAETTLGATATSIGTVTITPLTATGDVYVYTSLWTKSLSNTDQTLTWTLRTGNSCSAGTLLNTSTSLLTSGNNANGPSGFVSAIIVDPGASLQTYVVCGTTTTANGVSAGGLFVAQVIDTGADLAEIYTSTDSTIEAGDIVSIDSNLKTGMIKSTQEYDKRLLGVIATKPGIVIGSVEKEGSIALPVALKGRVPVKIDPSSNAIEAGEYITSSSLPGFGKKADKVGMVLGRAIENWTPNSGKSTVMVFVETQMYSPQNENFNETIKTVDVKNNIDIGSNEEFFNDLYAASVFTKNTSIQNSSVAENFKPVSSDITAGDLVSPIFDNEIKIGKSAKLGDSSVIGVVATSPGVVLNGKNDIIGKKPVAVSGSVPVKVTTENGDIKAGDRLIASSIPGFAMKACGAKFCNPSMTIGVALEDFNSNNSGDSTAVKNDLYTTRNEIDTQVNQASESLDIKEGLALAVNDLDTLAEIGDQKDNLIDITNITNNLTREIKAQTGEGRIMMYVNLSYTSLLGQDVGGNLPKTETQNNNSLMNSDLLGYNIQGDIRGVINEKITKVESDVEIVGNITVDGHLKFGEDSVGQVMILKGDRRVKVEYKNEYENQPLVFIQQVGTNVEYVLKEQNVKGFVIELSSKVSEDVLFNWMAIDSGKGKLVVSDETVTRIIRVQDWGMEEALPDIKIEEKVNDNILNNNEVGDSTSDETVKNIDEEKSVKQNVEDQSEIKEEVKDNVETQTDKVEELNLVQGVEIINDESKIVGEEPNSANNTPVQNVAKEALLNSTVQ